VEGWDISDTGTFVTIGVSLDGNFMILQLYGAEFVDLFSRDAETLQEKADAIAGSFLVDEIDDEFVITDFDGRDIAIADINNDEKQGVAIVVPFTDGNFGLIQAFSDPDEFVEEFVDLVLDIAVTFDSSEGGGTDAETDDGSGLLPLVLNEYAGEWTDAVAELQELEVIAFGGSLVFNENRAFFSGQGSFFTPLARRSPFTDIVMAGELNYTDSGASGGALEPCTLLFRVQTDNQGNTTTFAEVGLSNDDFAFYRDGTNTGLIAENIDMSIPQHLLVIAQNDELSVYLNGNLAIERASIPERSGTYGIALRGQGPGARCEGTNIWVYQAPAFRPGVCEISSGSTVNKRSGPGTNFDRAGQLAAGTVLEAVGQNQASDGFTWWKLEDDSWVRDDVVNAQGDCANIPETDE
jgi:hypothetical protein